ncbi:hypothetical protein E2C01_069182 [Portunus trituberculatus]|uniref:Uncharacterized protein n=1 Tax=Portunus trituberculatus TaxID=210409 RepID=A0A5B7HY66_PORTR|nr:hypothetical protein [Portunus trituberculatus]
MSTSSTVLSLLLTPHRPVFRVADSSVSMKTYRSYRPRHARPSLFLFRVPSSLPSLCPTPLHSQHSSNTHPTPSPHPHFITLLTTAANYPSLHSRRLHLLCHSSIRTYRLSSTPLPHIYPQAFPHALP